MKVTYHRSADWEGFRWRRFEGYETLKFIYFFPFGRKYIMIQVNR